VASLSDPDVRELLERPNHAIVSTHDRDGSIHSTIIWISVENEATVSINSAVGRRWPTNLERDPRVTLLVYETNDPYHFVEIRGTAKGTTKGADEHIDLLSKKYTGQDWSQSRRPSEQRVKFVVTPQRVRVVNQ
jgi:PPOX class probable F420-dependent enzyme